MTMPPAASGGEGVRLALLLLPLLAACSDDGAPTTKQARVAAAPTVSAPINEGDSSNAAIATPAPPPAVVRPKPLVSRGTPPRQTRGPDYSAIGTEPFWAVIVRGSTATLQRPDHAPLRFTIRVDNDGRAVRYLGDGFAMTLTEGPCSDGMSDAIWSDRVQVAFAEGVLKGCGGVREDEGYAP
ncbi:membrane-like protein [Sphingobium sp. HWE2-09]|uniref:membrane-like protein n=1 Tax=Sphingobium sp. HWE2-09 TaxID=3108390 RepID=UPI00403E3698